MNTKIVSPEATGSSAAGEDDPKTTRYTPYSDTDFLKVCETNSSEWAKNPFLVLDWVTQGNFDGKIKEFRKLLEKLGLQSGDRPGQAQGLREMDSAMDAAVKEVKVYVEYKFKKDTASAQFARYGIAKENRAYRLPRDRDKRKENLKLMIAAIHEDGFDANEFGQAFWAGMQAQYTEALATGYETTGEISVAVAEKNALRKDLNDVGFSLRLLLRANYPKTYPGIYRQWGWQKESY